VTGGEGDSEIWSLNDRGDRPAPSESPSEPIGASDFTDGSRSPDITRFSFSSRDAQGGSLRFDACDSMRRKLDASSTNVSQRKMIVGRLRKIGKQELRLNSRVYLSTHRSNNTAMAERSIEKKRERRKGVTCGQGTLRRSTRRWDVIVQSGAQVKERAEIRPGRVNGRRVEGKGCAEEQSLIWRETPEGTRERVVQKCSGPLQRCRP
jgi:hypothetical protein